MPESETSSQRFEARHASGERTGPSESVRGCMQRFSKGTRTCAESRVEARDERLERATAREARHDERRSGSLSARPLPGLQEAVLAKQVNESSVSRDAKFPSFRSSGIDAAVPVGDMERQRTIRFR